MSPAPSGDRTGDQTAEGLPDEGIIDIALAPHPKDRRRVLACAHPRDIARNAPRPATTTYKKLEEHGGLALVEARASKAARHQIRAHFAALGHPLLGDVLYGGRPLEGAEAAEGVEAPARHALHASRITWPGAPGVPAFTVTSELPEDLARLLRG